MQLPFAKYHGAGNDFVIFDDRNLKFPTEDQKFIEHLCEHRLGVGADGVVVLQLSEKADFRMRIFNADGKEAAQCGNGLRCLVDFIRRKYTNDLKNREFDKKGPQNFCSERATIAERLRTPTNSPVDCLSGKQVNEENRPEGGASENKNSEAAESKKRSEGPFSRGAGERSELARRDPTQSKTDFSSRLCISHPHSNLTIETHERIVHCSWEGDQITVDLGAYIWAHDHFPIDPFSLQLIHTGVPHAVAFVKDLAIPDFQSVASKLRFHKAFAPQGANVNFAQIKGDKIYMRTYERGVEEETLACGTGAAAVAVAAMKKYQLKNPICIVPASREELFVEVTPKTVKLRGRATFVFHGSIWY